MWTPRAIGVACTIAGLAAVAAPAAALGPGSTVLISRPAFDPLPAGAVNDSSLRSNGAVSDDGRYVVFDSGSDGLLAGPSRYQQVFRLDRLTGQLVLVSATPAGAPGAGDSGQATISDDGQVVAYQSLAQDLVAVQTNDFDDVFVRNLARAGTPSVLVSRASDNLMTSGVPGNSQSFAGQISGDGHSVLFSSASTNLDPADSTSTTSVFVRDLDAIPASTELISRADGAGATATSDAAAGSISDDGGAATFYTAATTLDPTMTDNNGRFDTYGRLRQLRVTRLVSRADGAGAVGGADSFGGALSGDGTTVAFESSAANLAPGGDGNGASDVFKRTDWFLGASARTSLVSRQAGLAQPGNGASTQAAISRDGSTVSFTSAATDLLSIPDTNGARDAFVRNGSGTHLLTHDAGAAPVSGAPTFELPTAALSGDGTVGVFTSSADDLSTIDDDDFQGVYAAGVAGGPVTHLSRPAGLAGIFKGGVNFSFGGGATVNGDGRYVAFTSSSDSLSDEDDDRLTNGFVRDVYAGTTTFVSRASGNGAAANGSTGGIAISADGTHVAFTSQATNLSPDDPDSATDVYVRDLATGTVVLVDRADGPGGAKANANASLGGIDGDGSRVTFSTTATNLGAGSDPDTDVFVRDLAAGTTVLASRADGAIGDQANATASGGSISADGNRVAFTTLATNMGDGDTDARRDAHVRDLAAGRTLLASRADGADGAKANADVDDANVSADGNHVVFTSGATNLGDGDSSASESAYVRDLGAGTTRLASRADGAGGATIDGQFIFAPRISGDGSRVIWGQFAGDLTGEAPSDAPQTFMRDLAAGRTLLVSRGDGAAGIPFPTVNLLTSAAISSSGHCVAVTGSPDAGFSNPQFVTPDFAQVYLRTVDGECAPAPRAAGGGGGPSADTVAPAISALSLLRSRFAVDRRHPTAAVAARKGRGRARRRRASNLGTEFRFRLSEPASVRIAIARELSGKRKGKRCVKPTRRLRRARRCTRLRSAGTLVRTRRPSGANRVSFSGRIGRKSLARGRYQATLVATDPAGNRSKPRTVRFRVVRPR